MASGFGHVVKSIIDDSEALEDDRWDFEGLFEEDQRRTQAAEPLWPGGTLSWSAQPH